MKTLDESVKEFNIALKEFIIVFAKYLKIDLFVKWLNNKLKR